MGTGINFSGMASGIDTASIVDQLMAIERRPITKVKQQQSTERTRLVRMRALNTKLLMLRSSADAVKGSSLNTSPFTAKNATSSDTATFTVTASNTASPGSFSVDVNALAKSQKVGGNAFNAAHGGGTLTIAGASRTANVSVTAGDDAQAIATKINADSESGLTGSVVNGRLILTGKSTGSAENYTLSMSSGPATLTDFGLQASVSDVAAQDAQITLAGITVTSSSNVFNNAINGVSITAVALGTAKNLSVTADTASAVNKVQDMVTKVNDIISQIQEDTKYDVATKQGGPLLGDSFVTSIAGQLTRQVTDTFDPNVGGNSGYENYTKIGLSVGRDGKLNLDTAKLRTALDANPSAVYNLFAREDGATSGSTKLNSAGNTTTMAQGDGIANRLSAFADMLISRSSAYNGLDANGARSTGAMVSRINAMNETISNFDKRVATLEDRVGRREKILRSQFTAMEKAISTIRSQGQQMSAQMGMS